MRMGWSRIALDRSGVSQNPFLLELPCREFLAYLLADSFKLQFHSWRGTHWEAGLGVQQQARLEGSSCLFVHAYIREDESIEEGNADVLGQGSRQAPSLSKLCEGSLVLQRLVQPLTCGDIACSLILPMRHPQWR